MMTLIEFLKALDIKPPFKPGTTALYEAYKALKEKETA